ncbi:protein LEO1 homolog [Silene latifolia]|uniref:protein LEO1 homolog n=1 Tax=Silene latifolia TaxID=37657 RepID=UPI003D771B16
MKEEKRHQMMQNLFGDQSEEEEEDEEEEELDSEHESNHHRPNYLSDENGGVPEQEVADRPYEEGQGEVEVESEGEYRVEEQEVGESEGEREQSSQEIDAGEHQDEHEARETDSDEKEDYSQRVVTSRRRDVVDSGSERSEEQERHYIDPEDEEEVGQTRSPGEFPDEERNESHLPHSTAEIRDVFGDSDDEEPAEYDAAHDMEQESKFPVHEEERYEKNLGPEDLVYDENAMYGSEEEIENKLKEKPVGPPMELEIPLRPPPADSDKMNLIRVSNIMGIDPKPFDPKTYVEEDVFVTDESGTKKRIRLENNIVRWRTVKKADGTVAHESNARFVRWSDGSLQLHIGNEVLDISVQDAQHDNAYLFLRHGKGILQSQGKLLKKMRFMPSSLSSNSHRLLTALVDSRHKKMYKVKNCITDVDPEKEKEKKERAESQSIRANSTLARKREKVNRRYTRPLDRGRQLSPGFLEDALEEDDEANYYDSRRSGSRRHFEDELEAEARAEKRIINAKKGQLKDIPRKSSTGLKPSRRPVDFSGSDNYETDGEEEEVPERPYEDSEPEWQDSEDDVEPQEEAAEGGASEEEAEEPTPAIKESRGSLKRKEYESDEESPRKKPTTHRRMAVVYDSDEE